MEEMSPSLPSPHPRAPQHAKSGAQKDRGLVFDLLLFQLEPSSPGTTGKEHTSKAPSSASEGQLEQPERVSGRRRLKKGVFSKPVQQEAAVSIYSKQINKQARLEQPMELDKRTQRNKVTGPAPLLTCGRGVGTWAEEVACSCVLARALAGLPSGTPSPAFGLSVIPALGVLDES